MQNKLYPVLTNALNEKKVVINLYGCRKCGLVFNADFDIKKTAYSSSYDNEQANSKYFHSYLIRLAERLNKKYKLVDKKVVEVGCGKGHFLKILYDFGVKNIKGFDPSYINYNPDIDRLVTKEFFNKENIKKRVDFIICRHVLEHISNPREFIPSVTRCLTHNGAMYFEFPDLEWIIKNRTFFDFFYEHCNYFSKRAIIRLFHQFGFQNIIFKYGLNGQYFQLEISRNGNMDYNDYPLINFNKISQFLNKQIKEYRKFIRGLKNFVIWGAGAKGVAFLNRLEVSRKQCKYVIDINPNKNKKFIPITGQTIVSPEILEKEKIGNIIIMNPMYEKEIKTLAAKYNYKGKFILL